jgi:hypothetical protein
MSPMEVLMIDLLNASTIGSHHPRGVAKLTYDPSEKLEQDPRMWVYEQYVLVC